MTSSPCAYEAILEAISSQPYEASISKLDEKMACKGLRYSSAASSFAGPALAAATSPSTCAEYAPTRVLYFSQTC
jgi:hypothetical protein